MTHEAGRRLPLTHVEEIIHAPKWSREEGATDLEYVEMHCPGRGNDKLLILDSGKHVKEWID